jgi:hypothetical protein
MVAKKAPPNFTWFMFGAHLMRFMFGVAGVGLFFVSGVLLLAGVAVLCLCGR